MGMWRPPAARKIRGGDDSEHAVRPRARAVDTRMRACAGAALQLAVHIPASARSAGSRLAGDALALIDRGTRLPTPRAGAVGGSCSCRWPWAQRSGRRQPRWPRDLAVAGAAARLRRWRSGCPPQSAAVGVEQRLGGQHDAWCAEAALCAAMLDSAAEWGQLSAGGEAPMVVMVRPGASSASISRR